MATIIVSFARPIVHIIDSITVSCSFLYLFGGRQIKYSATTVTNMCKWWFKNWMTGYFLYWAIIGMFS